MNSAGRGDTTRKVDRHYELEIRFTATSAGEVRLNGLLFCYLCFGSDAVEP
jgi:hypothetical protein